MTAKEPSWFEGGGTGPEKESGARRQAPNTGKWGAVAQQPRPQANRKHLFHANLGSAAQQSPDSPKLQSSFSFLPFPPAPPGNTSKNTNKKAKAKMETEVRLSVHSPLEVPSLLNSQAG